MHNLQVIFAERESLGLKVTSFVMKVLNFGGEKGNPKKGVQEVFICGSEEREKRRGNWRERESRDRKSVV